MRGGIQLPVCLALVVMTTLPTMTSSADFPPRSLMEKMIFEEENLLADLDHFIDLEYKKLEEVTKFYEDRLHVIKVRGKSSIDLSHPNSVFQVLQEFSRTYTQAMGTHFDSFHKFTKFSSGTFLPNEIDVRGATRSLLRLQIVYNLSAQDMYRGDYLGYQGPQLHIKDTVSIGETAFLGGSINQSLEWLDLAVDHYKKLQDTDTQGDNLDEITGNILALKGLTYQSKGERSLAEKLHQEAKRLAPKNTYVAQLGEELAAIVEQEYPGTDDIKDSFCFLCSLEKGIYAEKSSSRLITCRYREAGVPYYRFQEEILSVKPFVSVIYNVTTNHEAEHIQGFVKNDLKRAFVSTEESGSTSEDRISDVAWIDDSQSTVVSSLSRKISLITGHNLSQRPNFPFSSERYQVVNYGLGGHYYVHSDPIPPSIEWENPTQDGQRIATFLIYLNEVERGGATVFTRVNISVSPVKHMALFWYNYEPDYHDESKLTLHGGCPVLIGEKWEMVSYFMFCLLVAMVTSRSDVSGDDVVADACSPLCPEETVIEAVCGELSGCSNLSATANPEEFINCWTPCWVLADSCFSLCSSLYNILVQKCFTICKVGSDQEICIPPCFDISFLDIKERLISGQLSFTEILNEPQSPPEGPPSQPLSTKSSSELLSTKSPFKLTPGKSLSQLFLTKSPSVQSSTNPPPKSTQIGSLSGTTLAPKNSQISSITNEPKETITTKTNEQAEDSRDPKFASSPSPENNEFNERPQSGPFLKNKFLWKKIQQFHHRRNRLNLETMKKYHENFKKINFVYNKPHHNAVDRNYSQQRS